MTSYLDNPICFFLPRHLKDDGLEKPVTSQTVMTLQSPFSNGNPAKLKTRNVLQIRSLCSSPFLVTSDTVAHYSKKEAATGLLYLARHQG